ncbi:MAG: hypothetical protein ACOCQ0_02855 [Desulfosalsimonas sp.]
MAFGIKCWDANGNVTLDTTFALGKLVYSTIAKSGSSGSKTINGLSDHSKIGLCNTLVDEQADVYGSKLLHDVSRSGDTVSWSSRSTSLTASADTLILVFVAD